MTEVDRARRARERGDGRTWRERALAAEAERDALLVAKPREPEPKYLPTWAYLVTFAITAVVVVGIAWAVAWGWGR